MRKPGERYARKPTTHAERVALRQDAIGMLNGTSPYSKSGRAKLRNLIPKLRRAKEDERRAKYNGENRGGDEAIGARIRSDFSPSAEPDRTKVFGGFPREDNPQVWAREAGFAEQRRRRSLQLTGDDTLIDTANNLLHGSSGARFRLNAPTDLQYELRRLWMVAYYPLSGEERCDLVETILKAERYNAPEPEPASARR